MVKSRFSFPLVVLLPGCYWETKDCSVAGEAKICCLYRATVPAGYPSGAGGRAFELCKITGVNASAGKRNCGCVASVSSVWG